MEVTASAYNSLPYQTRPGSRGDIAAWGDTLRGDIRSIAVSRDLLDSGLTHNKRVWIEGLGGPYYVKDKMHYRWRKRIDIHLDKDVQAARNWGKKEVTIYYYP